MRYLDFSTRYMRKKVIAGLTEASKTRFIVLTSGAAEIRIHAPMSSATAMKHHARSLIELVPFGLNSGSIKQYAFRIIEIK